MYANYEFENPSYNFWVYSFFKYGTFCTLYVIYFIAPYKYFFFDAGWLRGGDVFIFNFRSMPVL